MLELIYIFGKDANNFIIYINFDLFQDIINFEPYKELFVALIEWWEYNESWQTYIFDKKTTNPDNLSAAEYYFRDDIYKIALNLNNYQPSLWEHIKTVEPNKNILGSSPVTD